MRVCGVHVYPGGLSGQDIKMPEVLPHVYPQQGLISEEDESEALVCGSDPCVCTPNGTVWKVWRDGGRSVAHLHRRRELGSVCP